jgi:hypothetical protein
MKPETPPPITLRTLFYLTAIMAFNFSLFRFSPHLMLMSVPATTACCAALLSVRSLRRYAPSRVAAIAAMWAWISATMIATVVSGMAIAWRGGRGTGWLLTGLAEWAVWTFAGAVYYATPMAVMGLVLGGGIAMVCEKWHPLRSQVSGGPIRAAAPGDKSEFGD